jgi:hypothetical protein
MGTSWGVFRHYWVVLKLLLTVGATGLLLLHMSAVSRASAVASGTLRNLGFRALQIRLVFDTALALVVLLAATTLSVYKPWGRTPYGQRKDSDERAFAGVATAASPNRDWLTGRSWPYALAVIVVLLVVVGPASDRRRRRPLKIGKSRLGCNMRHQCRLNLIPKNVKSVRCWSWSQIFIAPAW